MVSWADGPVFHAGMIVAWAFVTIGALWRSRRGDWPRRRAALFVSMAAGWVAQSVGDAASLAGVGPPVTDWLVAAFSLAFVVGLGYTVVLWRRSES
ncbi:hypothetical protein ACFQJD_14015 [Haloplanus sp. GCM10025708]|uniref:hypothetical protein n=1 Tax=Haloferacaceae TaxID=1644056 RepID=UPI0036175794